MEKAYFAAGCFWGIQQRFSNLDGVLETRVGYMGGQTQSPTYRLVCTGETGHAETVEVIFDERIVDFNELLTCFFSWHNPTEFNRQGPDVGSQYRTAIFPTSSKQVTLSRKKIDELNRTADFGAQIVTTIENDHFFWEAESCHQHYLTKRGLGHCGS